MIKFNIQADNQGQNEALLAKEQEIEALKNQVKKHDNLIISIKQEHNSDIEKIYVNLFF